MEPLKRSFQASPIDTDYLNQGCYRCRASNYCLPALCVHNNNQTDPMVRLVDRKRIFNPHESLCYKSQPLKYLFAVHSGSCKASYVDHSGREHVTNFFYPGDIIGLESIFFHEHLVDIVALETSHICYISLDRFKELHRQSAEIRTQLVNFLSHQLWQLYSMQGSYTAEEQVVQFLLNLLHHAKIRGESASVLRLSMGRHDIGSYLGLSSETVSRVMTRLKKQRLISVERNVIELLNLSALNMIANNED